MIATVEVHHPGAGVEVHRCPIEDDPTPADALRRRGPVEDLHLRVAAPRASGLGPAEDDLDHPPGPGRPSRPPSAPTPFAPLVTVAAGVDGSWRDLLGGTGPRQVSPTGLGDVAVDVRCPDSPVGRLAARILIEGSGRIATHWLDPDAAPDGDHDPSPTSAADRGAPTVAIVVDAPYRDLLAWLGGGRRLGELVAAGYVRIASIPLISFVTALLSSDPRDAAAPAVDIARLLATQRVEGLPGLVAAVAGGTPPTGSPTDTNP